MATNTTNNQTQQPAWMEEFMKYANQYRMQNATAQDLTSRYGFDFTREYANRVAEAEKQARQRALQQQQQQLELAEREFNRRLSQDYYQRYLEQMQGLANRGMNAGIAADANLRLQMNRQNQAASYMAQNRLQRDQIQQQLANLDQEAQARAEQLYQERLAQMFGYTTRLDELQNQYLQALMDFYSGNRQQDLAAQQFAQNLAWEQYRFSNLSAAERAQQELARAQLEWEKQKFKSEQEWQRYIYNNMSAYQKAQLEWAKQQFGDQLAWQMVEANMINDREWAALMYGGGGSAASADFYSSFLK